MPESAAGLADTADHPIPASQVARIKTWLEYGMAVPQVARLYGVTVSVIERLL
jgi:hypothetical protein